MATRDKMLKKFREHIKNTPLNELKREFAEIQNENKDIGSLTIKEYFQELDRMRTNKSE